MAFRFTFRGRDHSTGHAIVVAQDLSGAEIRFRSTLTRWGEQCPDFNAQLAWDTCKTLGMPLDMGYCILLHDGVSQPHVNHTGHLADFTVIVISADGSELCKSRGTRAYCRRLARQLLREKNVLTTHVRRISDGEIVKSYHATLHPTA